ncbi:MAG: class I SAM-dependent methyltransferase [Alsobacter sp.]
MTTPLARRIAALIAQDGPIGIDRYMALALADPGDGYYTTRDPFGVAGDFTTAPEITQMFGELIGLWAAAVWQRMGAPPRVVLCELGPGRGTLMRDALRAARALPPFRAAIDLHLVETSPVLRAVQAETLAECGLQPTWHASLQSVPPGPLLLLANEFLDALPVRQFVRCEGGWHERLVGLDADGGLAFGLSPSAYPALRVSAKVGAVLEIAAIATGVVSSLATRLVRSGGAALMLDYGSVQSGFGDTLQAVSRHTPVDPLHRPGDCDLTVHVDFFAIATAARTAGATVSGPVEQGVFLRALGLVERAAVLAPKAGAAVVDAAVARLAGHGPGEMGGLFKALSFGDPALGLLPGFESAVAPSGSVPSETP